jgi:PAS domain S-box-containing protein
MMVGERVERRRRRLPPRASSVAEARRMIRECLRDAGREDLVETAELLVSEIVTNALVHAGTPIDVAFSFLDGGLRVEVSDGSPHAPARRGYGPNAGTGRGLMLLEELVDEWGVVAEDPGKTVWFQLASTSDADDRSPGPAGTSRPAGDTLNVELVDVPLLLHEAWRQHAESLLREYLLASLDLDSPEDPIAVHSEASDAIALLAEHIPPSGVGEDPARVMVDATEPLVTEPRVDVAVPVGSVGHFSTLEQAIDTALGMVEDGMLLTPPTQPEVQGLREWLCGQVLGQSRGESPAPWMQAGHRARTDQRAVVWDTTSVEEATKGMIAADDEGRVLAVSPPALDLLGYPASGDLLGRRLVAIVPERYRQAHLAGFTMHFLSGRSLLLDRAVVVPALRRDGSEITVELTVRAERADDGRTVFVADLEPT